MNTVVAHVSRNSVETLNERQQVFWNVFQQLELVRICQGFVTEVGVCQARHEGQVHGVLVLHWTD